MDGLGILQYKKTSFLPKVGINIYERSLYDVKYGIIAVKIKAAKRNLSYRKHIT